MSGNSKNRRRRRRRLARFQARISGLSISFANPWMTSQEIVDGLCDGLVDAVAERTGLPRWLLYGQKPPGLNGGAT